ncbi:MAG: 1,4-dihydroxy-6-naphthoate synthase [Chitinophagales bacterium]|nr:1,4-dihydroxy-6-naphthoate synthase [Chitinophagales bacterium]
MKFTLGFSPCPNDTFIFYALLHNKIDTQGLEFFPVIEDVESLNRKAFAGSLDITKLSFATYFHVQHLYHLLDSGSALGNNCGPLLISKRDISAEEISKCSIAIPGINTTANLLFSFFFPKAKNRRELLFSEVEDAVLNGTTDLGVIIHENRFTYKKRGLKKVVDLGELWEQATGLPIPLGCIAANKNLPENIISTVSSLIRESVLYAFNNPDEVILFVKKYSQSMDEEVMWQHIKLYVTNYTVSLGEKGNEAVAEFLSQASAVRLPK